MKAYKVILSVGVIILLSLVGCRDNFAELNQDPSSVTEANVSYLFSQGILEFEPSGYTYWFYNAAEIYQWIQTGVPSGSVTTDITNGASFQGLRSIDVLKYANEIKYARSTMKEEDKAQYEQCAAALDILCVYLGLYDTDFVGDIPHTEAAQAIHGGTLTPKYDTVNDLYTLWLNSLDQAIKAFTSPTSKQVFIAVQDPIYNGDAAKWAKLANSLKLKLAVRLISQDKGKALKIAEEVIAASCGVLDGAGDDFIFNKAVKNTENDDYAYHWQNGILNNVSPSQNVIDFMVKNRDPRVRFIFFKNSWNSRIVDLFFEAKKQNQIPKYIMDNIDYEVGADGMYKFKAWKGAGEPWVRYYGVPLDYDAAKETAKFGDWFNWGEKCKYDDKHTYRPISLFMSEMIYGRKDFTYPTRPNDPVIQTNKEGRPWYGMYMTTGEVNLYLAELKLLGANLPKMASDYFDKAVRASVAEYDYVAGKNKIPYYDTNYGYDPNEKPIKLMDGEIDILMGHTDYKLTGNTVDDLEKVYLQQLFHFYLSPIDQYATARRSGIPKFNSALFPRKAYTQIPVTSIPRRMALSAPSPTDLMYNILVEAYKRQGFSIGSGPILNSERIWQDKNAPQWGEGPKL